MEYKIPLSKIGVLPVFTVAEFTQLLTLAQFEVQKTEGRSRIWGRIKTLAGAYKERDKEYQYDAFTFPEAMFIDLTRSKNIVETAVMGRKGTIDEVVNTMNWELTIRGILTDGCLEEGTAQRVNVYPDIERQKLARLCELDVPVRVQGEYLTNMGIHEILFKGIEFKAVEGFPTIVAFEIKAKSYEPYEITVAIDSDGIAIDRDFMLHG